MQHVAHELRGAGGSLGGARPKCDFEDDNGALYLVKFTAIRDDLPVERMEVAALRPAGEGAACRLRRSPWRARGASGGGRGSSTRACRYGRCSDWGEPVPGLPEVDFVAHCGGRLTGSFIHGLIATDVCSGSTEAVPLLVRERSVVVQGVGAIAQQLPVAMHGIDSRQRLGVSQRGADGVPPGPRHRVHPSQGHAPFVGLGLSPWPRRTGHATASPRVWRSPVSAALRRCVVGRASGTMKRGRVRLRSA